MRHRRLVKRLQERLKRKPLEITIADPEKFPAGALTPPPGSTVPRVKTFDLERPRSEQISGKTRKSLVEMMSNIKEKSSTNCNNNKKIGGEKDHQDPADLLKPVDDESKQQNENFAEHFTDQQNGFSESDRQNSTSGEQNGSSVVKEPGKVESEEKDLKLKLNLKLLCCAFVVLFAGLLLNFNNS